MASGKRERIRRKRRRQRAIKAQNTPEPPKTKEDRKARRRTIKKRKIEEARAKANRKPRIRWARAWKGVPPGTQPKVDMIRSYTNDVIAKAHHFFNDASHSKDSPARQGFAVYRHRIGLLLEALREENPEIASQEENLYLKRMQEEINYAKE